MARRDDGDSKKLHFKMDRFVQQNGQWYYMTREGKEHGPFDTKDDAEGDLIDYIRTIRTQESYGQ